MAASILEVSCREKLLEMTISPAPSKILGVPDVARQLLKKPPILLGLMLEVLPALYLIVYGKGSASGVVIMATVTAQMITLVGGLKVGALNSAIFSLLITVACFAPGYPPLAALLALIGGLWASLAASTGKGALVTMATSILTIMIMVPPQIAAGTNTHANHNVLAVLFFSVVSSVWGVAIGMMLRKGRTIPDIPGATWQWGVTQGAMVGVVLAVVAWIATARNLGQGGAWLLMTTYLVFKPMTPTPWRKSLNRAFGTMIGVAIVAVYIATLPKSAPPMALLFPASIMLVAAALTMLAQRWPYWCFVALFTPSIVLLMACTDASTKTVAMAGYLNGLRIEYSLLGIAIALAAQGVLVGTHAILTSRNSPLLKFASRANPGGS